MMQRRQLGTNGPWVSRLCFGALTVSPIQLNMESRAAGALIDYAFARGINCLDTAEFYQSYAQYRQARAAQAGGMLFITKCHAYDRAGAQESLHQALSQTGLARIDVMMLHEQESEWTLRGHAEALAYFHEQKAQGRIGQVGISTHFVACARAAARWPGIDVIEAICNEEGIGVADGTQLQMNEALRLAHQNGKGVIAMKALAGGHFRNRSERALQYALQLPFVDTVALGMQSREEVDYNLSLLAGTPDLAAKAQIETQPRTLHIADWCEGCGACERRCQNRAIRVVDGRAQVDAARCVLCGYCARACKEFCIKVY